jgi:hypothetical protein
MKPKSLLDQSFRYTPSFATNLKQTFDRIRRQLREAEARESDANDNVVPFERTQGQRSR